MIQSNGSRSISIRGDRRYVDAVHLVAKRRGTNSAALVREALDKLFGEELAECQSFLANSEPNSFQKELKRDKNAG